MKSEHFRMVRQGTPLPCDKKSTTRLTMAIALFTVASFVTACGSSESTRSASEAHSQRELTNAMPDLTAYGSANARATASGLLAGHASSAGTTASKNSSSSSSVSSTGFWIAGGLVAALGIFLAYKYFKNKKKSSSSATTNSATKSSPEKKSSWLSRLIGSKSKESTARTPTPTPMPSLTPAAPLSGSPVAARLPAVPEAHGAQAQATIQAMEACDSPEQSPLNSPLSNESVKKLLNFAAQGSKAKLLK